MSGPDGLEQRTADLEETSALESERLDAFDDTVQLYTVEEVAAEVLLATREANATVARLVRENEAMRRQVAQLHSHLAARNRLESA